MEIKGTIAASQQTVQKPQELQRQDTNSEVALQAEKKNQAQQSQQVKKTPPPPDKGQGQTFSQYA